MANNLPVYWNRPVGELAQRHEVVLTPEQRERHQIYALLLMAIAAQFWNGNKYGQDYVYPLNPRPGSGPSVRLRESYMGHNIAALAVAGDGEVIDFEFNHNETFNSSVEHAESRMLRRIFALRQINDSWDVDGHRNEYADYSTLLSKVSIYTTLESCSQCSGIMTLAGTKEVIYLQSDPKMYNIGDILRRLSEDHGGATTYLQAPLPIAGRCVGLDAFDRLDAAYQEFARAQTDGAGQPFAYKTGPNGEREEKWSASVTSFLCTAAAYSIFATGEPRLLEFERRHFNGKCHGRYCPPGSARANEALVHEALDFLAYVKAKGHRATCHKV